jgi:hypothetical protein
VFVSESKNALFKERDRGKGEGQRRVIGERECSKYIICMCGNVTMKPSICTMKIHYLKEKCSSNCELRFQLNGDEKFAQLGLPSRGRT